MGTKDKNAPAPTPEKTNAELTADVDQLREMLHNLNVKLFGDVERRARYEQEVKGYVTPRMAEPPPGRLDELDDSVKTIATIVGEMQAFVDGKLTESTKHLDFVKRVGAWIGPLMDDSQFQPPLNGAQIASKRYVDDAVARLSGALRGELEPTMAFTKRMFKQFVEVTANLGPKGGPVDAQRRLVQVLEGAADSIFEMWSYIEKAKFDADDKPPTLIEKAKVVGRFLMSGRIPEQR